MIYNHIFGFTKAPFERGLDSGELFQAPLLDELHSRLRYLVDTRATGLLTGEPGSGKSTALRRLRDELHPEQVRTVYLHDTAVNPGDFCRQIALERLTVRYALRGFDRDTTRLYLEHRLKIAGCDRPLFIEPAIEALWQASQGVMRRIDTLAHHTLAAAAEARATRVEPDHVLKAAEETRP